MNLSESAPEAAAGQGGPGLPPACAPRQLYPEWPLAATSIVERGLAIEVAAALLRINGSHRAVRSARAAASAPGESNHPLACSGGVGVCLGVGVRGRGRVGVWAFVRYLKRCAPSE